MTFLRALYLGEMIPMCLPEQDGRVVFFNSCVHWKLVERPHWYSSAILALQEQHRLQRDIPVF